MENNITNYIFSINKILQVFAESKTNVLELQRIANFINQIKNTSDDFNIYFLINQDESLKEKNKELIREFLKKYKIPIRENNIQYLSDNSSPDIVFKSLSEIIDDKNDFYKTDTIFISTNNNLSEVAFIEGYFSIYLEFDANEVNNKIDSDVTFKTINISEDDVNFDSLKYDFISFIESSNL